MCPNDGPMGLNPRFKDRKILSSSETDGVYEGASEVLRLGIANGMVKEFVDGS